MDGTQSGGTSSSTIIPDPPAAAPEKTKDDQIAELKAKLAAITAPAPASNTDKAPALLLNGKQPEGFVDLVLVRIGDKEMADLDERDARSNAVGIPWGELVRQLKDRRSQGDRRMDAATLQVIEHIRDFLDIPLRHVRTDNRNSNR